MNSLRIKLSIDQKLMRNFKTVKKIETIQCD